MHVLKVRSWKASEFGRDTRVRLGHCLRHGLRIICGRWQVADAKRSFTLWLVTRVPWGPRKFEFLRSVYYYPSFNKISKPDTRYPSLGPWVSSTYPGISGTHPCKCWLGYEYILTYSTYFALGYKTLVASVQHMRQHLKENNGKYTAQNSTSLPQLCRNVDATKCPFKTH